MASMTRAVLRAVVRLDARLKSLAVRLTRLTGKSPVDIHPKHLADTGTDLDWHLRHVGRGMRVLDVGCGNGMRGVKAALAGATVVGVDHEVRNLRAGLVLAAESGASSMTLVFGNLERELPLSDGQFDVVLLLDVVEHLHRRVELLRQIRRVLRPGGRLLVSAPIGTPAGNVASVMRGCSPTPIRTTRSNTLGPSWAASCRRAGSGLNLTLPP